MTTGFKGSSERREGKKRIDQLSDAAQIVQAFTYDLAAHLDPNITTELMLTSRRLERLAERLAKEPRVMAAITHTDKQEIPPDA